MGLEEYIGTKVLLFTLTKQDPIKLADKVADLFGKFLDDELGAKHSKTVRIAFVPWFSRFVVAFNSRLLKHQK